MVTRELHRALIESEGFPFEPYQEICDQIAIRVRGRRWYYETSKTIEAFSQTELSNNAKA